MNRIDLPTICGHELFIEMEEEIDTNGVKKAIDLSGITSTSTETSPFASMPLFIPNATYTNTTG